MPPALRMPKSPIKSSSARHDELCKEHDHRSALDPECPICQLPIGKKSPEGVKEGYSVLPCGHVFGNVCIKTYLSITDKPQCPICRTDLFHSCSHPVHPAPYDHKQARRSPSETASKVFFVEFRLVSCNYCRKRQAKLMKRLHRREILDNARATASSSFSPSSSSSAASTADGSRNGTESPAGAPTRKATRWASRTVSHTMHMTIALARLTLDAAGIRKIKTHNNHGGDNEEDVSGTSSSELDDDEIEEDEDDDDDNISVAAESSVAADDSPIVDSPESPPHHASRSGLPPVPGPYGHWDLAHKERDWKFLSWYNGLEPKINPPREHYS